MARPFVLDTDIGTNVDDLLALLFVLGSPELELVGVTTVSGDTAVRAAVARHALALAGRPDVPVVAGAGEALSARPARWRGYEADLAPARPSGGERGDHEDAGAYATEWLLAASRRHAGRLEIGSIAPMTNLALALRADPGFARRVGRVHLMGGGAVPPDHNLAADAVSAAEVIASLDVELCGVDATSGVTLDEEALRAVLGGPVAAGTALGRLVLDNARRLWDDRGVTGSVPHDPLALLPAVRPDLVRVVTGPLSVVAEGPSAGAVVAEGPPRRRVVAITAEGVAETFRRIAAALLPESGRRRGG